MLQNNAPSGRSGWRGKQGLTQERDPNSSFLVRKGHANKNTTAGVKCLVRVRGQPQSIHALMTDLRNTHTHTHTHEITTPFRKIYIFENVDLQKTRHPNQNNSLRFFRQTRKLPHYNTKQTTRKKKKNSVQHLLPRPWKTSQIFWEQNSFIKAVFSSLSRLCN